MNSFFSPSFRFILHKLASGGSVFERRVNVNAKYRSKVWAEINYGCNNLNLSKKKFHY